jgi:hypothetical protein
MHGVLWGKGGRDLVFTIGGSMKIRTLDTITNILCQYPVSSIQLYAEWRGGSLPATPTPLSVQLNRNILRLLLLNMPNQDNDIRY